MMNEILTYGFLLPVVLFCLTGILAERKNKSLLVVQLTRVIPFLAVAISIVGGYFVYTGGIVQSNTIGIADLGFSIRLDALSLIMFAMVSIIGLVVFRFSYNYLEGDAVFSSFIGKLAITVACVQLLVLSGNILMLFLAWVATSLALHQLLVIYSERRKANIAARKKFIVARLGDVSLLVSLALVYTEFGNGNLEYIFTQLRGFEFANASWQLELAAGLLVITAGLKSAQIPFHSWLLEVMEAPTPVSALLHAGLLNAGPFLIIRFAYLMDAVTVAPIVLFLMGAITAFYGSVVFTTQPSIKTSLAYSSVAHMGFTLMLSGLGVYAASLLHLVAHSFYKAHAFLSSGSLVEKVRTKAASDYARKGSVGRVLLGFVLAVGLIVGIGKLLGVSENSDYQLLLIGAMILVGVMKLLINTFDSGSLGSTMLKSFGLATLVLVMFFSLEEAVSYILGNQIPVLSEPTSIMKMLSGVVLLTFFLTVLYQSLVALPERGGFFKRMGIHARNGFYINVIFDRAINTLKHKA